MRALVPERVAVKGGVGEWIRRAVEMVQLNNTLEGYTLFDWYTKKSCRIASLPVSDAELSLVGWVEGRPRTRAKAWAAAY